MSIMGSEVDYGNGRNKVRLECIWVSGISRFPEKPNAWNVRRKAYSFLIRFSLWSLACLHVDPSRVSVSSAWLPFPHTNQMDTRRNLNLDWSPQETLSRPYARRPSSEMEPPHPCFTPHFRHCPAAAWLSCFPLSVHSPIPLFSHITPPKHCNHTKLWTNLFLHIQFGFSPARAIHHLIVVFIL